MPYVKKGIEAWQPAFEEAGFLKAIVAKDAPTPQEDPDWSADDARYSAIRWVPSTTANAMGPHVSDPRSGEILEADVEIYHNVQQLARDWYWVQAGPLDPRAKTLPLPDSVMGDILVFIVTHEVGHSLGLPHNFKASGSLHHRADPGQELGQEEQPRPDPDGLRPLQLRGPARGQDRPDRPHPQDRALRQLHHQVGLRAHPDGQDAG